MSLNMYLGETDTQVGEMNTICKKSFNQWKKQRLLSHLSC